MKSEFASINDRDFPCVVVTFTGQPAQPDTFERYLAGLSALYERKEKFSLIFDARRAKFLPWRYQRRQADWTRDHQPLIGQYLHGTAYVVPSLLLRLLLMSIFSLQRTDTPNEVTRTMEEARRWTKINRLRRQPPEA